MAGDILGRAWDELSRSVVEDRDGDIAGLFARRETWSGRTIQWNVDNKRGRVPVEWAGMPIFDSERELVGFRGFGLVRKAALAELVDEVVVPEASPPDAPDETPAAIADSQVGPAEDEIEETVIEIEPDVPVVAEEAHREPVLAVAEEAEDLESHPEPEVEPEPEPEPEPRSEPELTDDEKLFEQLRETVAASLSEPTIEIYGHGAIDRPSERAPAPTLPRQAEPQSGLSNTERHAFREIARALGARFEADPVHDQEAGSSEKVVPFRGLALVPEVAAEPDEESDVAAAAEPEPAEESPADKFAAAEVAAGDVPDRTPPADLPEVGDHDGAEAIAIDGEALLRRLPMPALVRRGDHVDFANRAFLMLAGYDDREHIAAAGGLPRLFGTTPLSAGGAILSTRQHHSVPVEVQIGSVEWNGAKCGTPARPALAGGGCLAAPRRQQTRICASGKSRIQELESILDTATDGVVVLDETGRILSLNRSAEALFGYNQSDVVGDAITVLLSPESHIVALDYLEGLRSPGVRSLLNDGREVFGRVRQGGAIPLFMTMGRVSDGPDRKLCAVLRDITPFKKAEGELVGARRAAEQANAQKSDLLAKISHEIRTPLNAILGFAEVMLEERFGPIGNDRYKEYLKDVHASGAHVISLVNDLLDLAKVEAGRMDLSFTSVSLNDLVSNCFTLLQPQAARDRIVMRTSFAAKLPPVVADDRSLRQIVLNLVSNAIKFTDAGGQVIVSTALTDRGEVAFRVRDTGIGMNDEEVQAALEPFRQLATSRKRGGTGLGLPLTKALVEANRGALQISSQPHEGTLVEVIFPPTRVLAE